MYQLISTAKNYALSASAGIRLSGRTTTLRYIALLLLIVIGSVQYLNAQDYAVVKIEDSRSKPLAVVAGKNFDGHLYHQELGDANGDNALWQFVSTGDGYYNIVNLRNNKAIVKDKDNQDEIWAALNESDKPDSN